MPANLVERLRADADQLRKMQEQARFGGDHTHVRVANPGFLLSVLSEAAAEIERLEAERDEARDDAKFAERIAQKREEEANERAEAAEARCDKLAEALAWYAEQTRLCRLIHSGGDAGRGALAEDGGKRAREALEQVGKP